MNWYEVGMKLYKMVGTKGTWLWYYDTNLYSCSSRSELVLISLWYMN